MTKLSQSFSQSPVRERSIHTVTFEGLGDGPAHVLSGSPNTFLWSRLPEFLKQEPPTEGKHATGVVFGAIRETDGKRRALNESVISLDCLGLDFDDLTDEGLDRVLAGVAPYSRVGWFTHSYLRGAKGLSCRIVLLLARPIAGAEWPAFWRAAVEKLGVADLVDGQCKNPARLFYTTCPPGAEAGFAASVDLLSGEGEYFDVELTPRDPPRINDVAIFRDRPERCLAGTDPLDHAIHLAATMPPSISGQGGHNACLAVARAIKRGLERDDDETFLVLHDVYNPRCVPPWSDAELHHKVAEAGKDEGAPYPSGALLSPQARQVELKALRKTAQSWEKSKGSKADDGAKLARMLDGQCPAEDLAESRAAVARVVRRLVTEFPDIDAAHFAEQVRLSLEHPSGSGVSPADVVSMIERQQSKAIVLSSSTDLARLKQIFTEDRQFAGRFRLDVLSNRPFDDVTKALLTDDLLTKIRVDISERYGFDPKDKDTGAVLRNVASARAFHPVKDYLEGLRWNGRTADLCDYFSVEPTELNEYALRAQLVAAVARAFESGRKADVCLILEGPQGFRKSTAVEALCPVRDWFADSELAWGSKDAPINLLGKWIYEIPEIDGFRGKEPQTVKAFLSRRYDRYRAPYATSADDHVRTTVFFGTTNASFYLQDKTGERRYRPVRVIAPIDVERIVKDRDQIWAEAVALYRRGFEFWTVPEGLHDALKAAQGERAEADSVEELLAGWLEGKESEGVSFPDACSAASMSGSYRDDARVSRALTALGWEKRSNVGARKLKRWFPKSA